MIAGRRKPGERAAATPPASSEQAAPARRTRRSASSDDAEAAPQARRTSTRAPRAPRSAPPADANENTGSSANNASTEEPKPAPARRRAPSRRPADTPRESTRMAAVEAPQAEAAMAPAFDVEVMPDDGPLEQPEAELAAVTPVADLAPITPAVAPARSTPSVTPQTTPDGDPSALGGEIGRLRALVEQQRMVLAELRAGMLTLGEQVDRGGYRPRLGVFIDVPNLMYGVESGRPVHMGRLLDMMREGRQLVRATAYSPVSDDPREPIEQQKFVSPFVPYDYRIVTKSLKRFADGSIKGNFDVEMAIDMVSMSDRVDVIAIVSGDADFARAVEAVQNKGVRVEVVAFAGSTSLEMRALADHYLELSTVANRISV